MTKKAEETVKYFNTDFYENGVSDEAYEKAINSKFFKKNGFMIVSRSEIASMYICKTDELLHQLDSLMPERGFGESTYELIKDYFLLVAHTDEVGVPRLRKAEDDLNAHYASMSYNDYYGIKDKDDCSVCRGGGCFHCEPHRFL